MYIVLERYQCPILSSSWESELPGELISGFVTCYYSIYIVLERYQCPILSSSWESELLAELISGFVTLYCDEDWWVACVVQVHADTSELRLSFLHPHGPSHSFRCPYVQDILSIPMFDILSTVDPRSTKAGCVYSLIQKDTGDALEKLTTRK